MKLNIKFFKLMTLSFFSIMSLVSNFAQADDQSKDRTNNDQFERIQCYEGQTPGARFILDKLNWELTTVDSDWNITDVEKNLKATETPVGLVWSSKKSIGSLSTYFDFTRYSNGEMKYVGGYSGCFHSEESVQTCYPVQTVYINH